MKRVKAVLITTGLMVGIGSMASGPAFAQDAAKGKQVFNQCMACHALDHAVVGPPLGGVIGRKAGSVDGYSYSPLMKAAGDAGLVWSTDEIAKYLVNPTSYLTDYVKGKGKDASGSSKMAYMLANEKQRQNVAAYLATTTK